MTGATNLEWAAALIDELVSSGTEWFIVAPGSRSTPLVLAAAAHPGARTVVHLDERSAAFFALGIGKATNVPAAVITTSGTAVANLLPAVVEAAQSESPLILLTADRPPHLRGGDANQAIEQPGIFGNYPRLSVALGTASADPRELDHVRQIGSRAVAAAGAQPQGPVHINVPFRKPLQPDTSAEVAAILASRFNAGGRGSGGARSDGPFTRIVGGYRAAAPEAIAQLCAVAKTAERPVVVAGPAPGGSAAGEAAGVLADQWGIPLIADPLSGARFELAPSQNRVEHADLFLGHPDVRASLLPDLVIRFGRSPTSTRLVELCAQVTEGGGSVVSIDGAGQWKDHRASLTHAVAGDPLPTVRAMVAHTTHLPHGRSRWGTRWAVASAAAREALIPYWTEASFEGAIARSAARAIPENGTLFIGSSMPIRDVDAFVASDDFAGRALGNRGASGIDGVSSTALGAALATGSPLLCLVGDVSFLHDIGGLLAARAALSPVVFVVVNNDGGAIFHTLPIREHEPEFTEFFATPHGRDFRHAAALYDLSYARVPATELESHLHAAFAAGGVHVVEVPSDRVHTLDVRNSAAERTQAAVRDALASIPAGQR